MLISQVQNTDEASEEACVGSNIYITWNIIDFLELCWCNTDNTFRTYYNTNICYIRHCEFQIGLDMGPLS